MITQFFRYREWDCQQDGVAMHVGITCSSIMSNKSTFGWVSYYARFIQSFHLLHRIGTQFSFFSLTKTKKKYSIEIST